MRNKLKVSLLILFIPILSKSQVMRVNSNSISSGSVVSGDFVQRTGDTMTGQLTIVSSLTIISPLTNAYQMIVTTSPGQVFHHFNITNFGRVGIGVKSPNALLEVAGNILLSSDTTVTNRQFSIIDNANNIAGTTLTVRAANGFASPGGALILRAGNGATGNPSGGSEDGGDATLNAGNSGIDGGGGTVIIGAGNGTTGVNNSGTAGNVNINAGSALSADFSGGNIRLTPGSGSSNGNIILAHTGSAARGNVGIGTSSPCSTCTLHLIGKLSVTNGATFDAGTGVTFSSSVFAGTGLSTQTAGGAGAAVTALCPTGKFAMGGGCVCSGGVALTGDSNSPNCSTAGCIPNGWTCQEPGGTGGACSAYAICTRIQ